MIKSADLFAPYSYESTSASSKEKRAQIRRGSRSGSPDSPKPAGQLGHATRPLHQKPRHELCSARRRGQWRAGRDRCQSRRVPCLANFSDVDADFSGVDADFLIVSLNSAAVDGIRSAAALSRASVSGDCSTAGPIARLSEAMDSMPMPFA